MDRLNLKAIEQKLKEGKEIQFLRVIVPRSGKSRRVILGDTNNPGDSIVELPTGVLNSSRDEIVKSRSSVSVKYIDGDLNEVIKAIVEAVRPKRKLVIFGAGNVGQAVGLMGSLLGFDVILIDDRAEFASRKRFPDHTIKLIVADYLKVITDLSLTADVAVVIVTRGHQYDEVCLRGMVGLNVGYLGMIGSKRRVLSIIDRLEREGYRRSDFEKLHAPIGLRIGARSPQEIAVAILAEIISHFNHENIR